MQTPLVGRRLTSGSGSGGSVPAKGPLKPKPKPDDSMQFPPPLAAMESSSPFVTALAAS